jgi:hypothetical protein
MYNSKLLPRGIEMIKKPMNKEERTAWYKAEVERLKFEILNTRKTKEQTSDKAIIAKLDNELFFLEKQLESIKKEIQDFINKKL